jgi:hypothetical protein
VRGECLEFEIDMAARGACGARRNVQQKMHQEIRQSNWSNLRRVPEALKRIERGEAARVGSHTEEALAPRDPSAKRRRRDVVDEIGRCL